MKRSANTMRRETRSAEAGRLDAFLARAFPGMSRQFWKQRIAEGSVTVEGAPRDVDFRLKGGETVEVRWETKAGPDLESRLLHEDAHVLVLDKPSGLIVHPLGTSWLRTPEALEAEPDCVAGWLWRARPGNRTLPRVGIVHRLDQGTSGVMVVAKTAEAHRSLVEAFRDRKVEKRYRAIVAGRMEGPVVEVDTAVGRRGHERKVKVDPGGRPALTEVHILKTARAASLVEARPKTGRTHQIRVHLQSLGHPVLGDREWMSAEAITASGAPRLMLHAFRLAFAHPRTGRRVEFEAKPPRDFSECWKRLASGRAGRS